MLRPPVRLKVKMAKEQILFAVFIRDHMGNRIGFGIHQAYIENYTCCVDLRGFDIGTDLQMIELEFMGKSGIGGIGPARGRKIAKTQSNGSE